MLGPLEETHGDFVIIRFAVQFEFSKKMAALGMNSSDVDEFRALLRQDLDLLGSPDRLCEIPFDSRRESRYSDGTFGVFYASLDEGTAISEITHWFTQWLYGDQGIRIGYYTRFLVQFGGQLKDITVMKNHWHSLTSDAHDRFCKSIATEARTSGLDAIVVPSVRSKDQSGKNVVVFSKDSLGHPTDFRFIQLTHSSETDEVEYQWIS